MTVETVAEDDGVRVLRTRGEIDVTVVPTVLPQVPSLVAGARAVVLDTTEATFFDSSGVRLVDGLARACSAARLPFRVVAPPGSRARRVLDLVGLSAALVDDDLAVATARTRAASAGGDAGPDAG
jgi:anti-sigma B factor antagonist